MIVAFFSCKANALAEVTGSLGRAIFAAWLLALTVGASADVATAQTLPSGVINAPPTVIGDSQSIGSDTTLNVSDGGKVGWRFSAGAADGSSANVVVNISGGEVRSEFNANAGSEINISGGSVGYGIATALYSFNANAGSIVTITGGDINEDFNARSGSQIYISGGSFGLDEFGPVFYAEDGSTVSISGGEFGRGFLAAPRSNLAISGGTFGDFFSGLSASISGGAFGSGFWAATDNRVQLIGGDFLLNGVEYSDEYVTIGGSDTLTGTLEDGSAFVFTPLVRDNLVNVRLVDGNLPTYVPSITVTDANGPKGLRPGQTITLEDGGLLPANFAAAGGTLNINGGSVDVGFEAVGTEINITGGSIGYDAGVFAGSVVNMSGGSIGTAFQAWADSEVNVSGGSIAHYRGQAGSTAKFSGGAFHSLSAHSGSLVQVQGGTFDRLDALDGSQITLFGSSFALNGVPIDMLSIGESLTITDRDQTLTGVLSDGSAFSFDLDSTNSSSEPYFFAPDATLTITLTAPGDFNADGAVDGQDFLRWQRGELPNALNSDALAHWTESFGAFSSAAASSAAVPEPAAGILLLMALVCRRVGKRMRRSDRIVAPFTAAR